MVAPGDIDAQTNKHTPGCLFVLAARAMTSEEALEFFVVGCG